jgi:DNA-binding HxlR family transcriptional regulator
MGGSVNQRSMKRAVGEKEGAKGASGRRSPCPVACSLDLMGDRWTLLVVRDLMMGAERFKEITASPEGIPTNILSDRLGRLLESGVVVQVAAADGSRHPAYRLTEKGRELIPILGAMRDGGLKWEAGTRVMAGREG